MFYHIISAWTTFLIDTKGINGLLALHSSLASHSPHLLPTLTADTSLRAPLAPETKHARGKEFFARIYARHTDRVLASMAASSGGDLDHFAVASIYGELMAETSIVGDAETGLLEFVCCLADGVAPQAKGYVFPFYLSHVHIYNHADTCTVAIATSSEAGTSARPAPRCAAPSRWSGSSRGSWGATTPQAATSLRFWTKRKRGRRR